MCIFIYKGMGCCEFRDSEGKKRKSENDLVLLSAKSHKGNKKVSFVTQPIRLTGIYVKEVEEVDWEIPTDMSSWQVHTSNNIVKISYLGDSGLQVGLTITFAQPVNYELLLLIINKPKHRLEWDNSIQKMILYIGDDVLDGKISYTYRNLNTREVFDRFVRNVKGVYYIVYRQYEQGTRGNYNIFKFDQNGKVFQAFFKIRIVNIEEYLEKKKEWAEFFYKEVLFHMRCSTMENSNPVLESSVSMIDSSIDLTPNIP